MATRSHFTADARARVIEAIGAGASQPDAAEFAGIAPSTLQRWLQKGRKDPDGTYGQFAADADAALANARLRAAAGVDERASMDRAELKLVVSHSARRGSVQHQKLMRDLLNDDLRGDDADEPTDPLAEFDVDDEVAARRAAKVGQ